MHADILIIGSETTLLNVWKEVLNQVQIHIFNRDLPQCIDAQKLLSFNSIRICYCALYNNVIWNGSGLTIDFPTIKSIIRSGINCEPSDGSIDSFWLA